MRAICAAIIASVCLISPASAQGVWQSFNQGLQAGQQQRADREAADIRVQRLAACRIARDQALEAATGRHSAILMIVGDNVTAEQRVNFEAAYNQEQSVAQNNYADCLSQVR